MSIVTTIMLAFFGGVLATCMGALGSVILCAFVALAGVCAVWAGCEYNIVTNIAFGFFLSPHLGLGPAACALGYAAKKGYVEDSKGIALPLMMLGKVDVLIVGGLFAVLSYYINVGLAVGLGLQGRLDTVSTSIVVIGIISKIMFGNEGLFGKVPEGDKRFGVHSKNNWMPHMPYGNGIYYWFFAGGAGLISTYIYWEMVKYGEATNNMNLIIDAQFPMFALAVIFLILLVCGLPCPVFHHVGLTSAYAAMTAYAAGGSQMQVLLWGMAWGIISHFVADWLADVFLVYGDGYVDPPSLSMAACSVVIYLIFPAIGLYKGACLTIVPVVLLVLTGILAVVVQNKRNAAIKLEADATAA